MAAFFTLVISTPPRSYGELNHTLRVVTMLAATAVAMWISYLRGQRNVQLWTARSETRDERRRRVAAETAQRMQTMARALTTAADPAQVADAVFAAMRDELDVDASTFALLDERGSLHTLRRFGYRPDDPTDGVLASLRHDGPVLGENVAFFSETIEDLQRDRPDILASANSDRFRALAIIPLVVSDHTIGTVVVHWEDDREISEPDRTFLFTITGAAAQAVERAPPHPHRVRQSGAQPAPPPAQFGAGGGHDAGRRRPCRHCRWPARTGRALRRGARPRPAGSAA